MPGVGGADAAVWAAEAPHPPAPPPEPPRDRGLLLRPPPAPSRRKWPTAEVDSCCSASRPVPSSARPPLPSPWDAPRPTHHLYTRLSQLAALWCECAKQRYSYEMRLPSR